MHLVDDVHEPLLLENGFRLEDVSVATAWRTYHVNNAVGKGVYRLFSPDGSYAIVIHDFTLFEDIVMHFETPSNYLSITWYDSVSGEALQPYRRMKRGFVKGYLSEEGYHALVHKNIPIYCVGIEITPAYTEKYLKARYPGEEIDPEQAFRSIDEDTDFPEMVYLLHQVKNHSGGGTVAELFFEGKVHEAVALLVERARQLPPATPRQTISIQDTKRLETVASYVNDHCAQPMRIETLAQIACMSATKLKKLFRQQYDVTITEYTQQRRISHAEALLASSDLPIAVVAKTVGYQAAGRFSKLFAQYTGLLPSEYRRLMQRNPNQNMRNV